MRHFDRGSIDPESGVLSLMSLRRSRPLVIALVIASLGSPQLAWAEVLGKQISIEDPSGKALDPFHAALKQAEQKKGRARLLFYGDSHIASDHYTGMIRSTFQARFGSAGAGFVPLVLPFDHYRHSLLQVAPLGLWQRLRARGAPRTQLAVGLAGVGLETADEAIAFIEPGRHKGHASRATRFDLFYLRQPKGGTMEVRVDGGAPEKMATASSSQEVGFRRFKVSDGLHRLEVKTKGDGPVRIFGASVERLRPGVIVDTLGIPGARARDQLPWNAAVQTAQLRRLAPHLFVLAYGTNEAIGDRSIIPNYETHLRAVLGRLRKALPRSSCLLIGPSDLPERQDDGSYGLRKRVSDIIDVQRRVAGEEGCGFFDLVAFMGGPGSMPRWVKHQPPLARDDHTHLTKAGHERLAAVLGKALLKGYSSPSAD